MVVKISDPVKVELELFEKEYESQFQPNSDFLIPLLEYVNQEKGKHIRPTLFFLVQGLIGKPNLKSIRIAVLLEMLHVATLIHDDVVDDSFFRRGRKTPNALWGNKVAVLLGDYLLAKVLSLGVEAPWKDVLKIISRVVMDMGRGELRQVVIGTTAKQIDEKEYYRIIKDKTAALFQATCELAGLIANGTQKERARLNRLGEYFGMSFQIRDDILDLTGKSELMGKPAGQDICNGKITLPIILALKHASEIEKQRFFKKLASEKEIDTEWIFDFVGRKKGIQRAQAQSALFADKAIAILSTFGSSIYRESIEKLVKHDLVRVI
ncbi:polyprenyl synthetase family protein [bacterium]|nr:polyprenyl synthetase family protein [bacterium]RQV98564.1 MAG: polyprenyl synthetase family protein [bacterium]